MFPQFFWQSDREELDPSLNLQKKYYRKENMAITILAVGVGLNARRDGRVMSRETLMCFATLLADNWTHL